MKVKKALISLLVLSLMPMMNSCEKDEVAYLNAKYVFGSNYWFKDESTSVPVAALTYDESYLCDGFENIKEQKTNIIAGDVLKITYSGELNVATSYPGQMSLKGTLKSYTYYPSTIYPISNVLGDKEESNTLLYIKNLFTSCHNKVIINDKLEYQSIDDYYAANKVDNLYYSVYYEPPVYTETPPSLYPYGQLYAYNPREVK